MHMTLSAAKRKANDKYIANNYKRLCLAYPRDYVERIKAKAQDHDETIQGYIKKAIDKRMQEEEPQE